MAPIIDALHRTYNCRYRSRHSRAAVLCAREVSKTPGQQQSGRRRCNLAPPRELTNGCLPAKKGNKLTTPPAAPAKDDALQQAHTPPLTRGGVVAGKTDPAASPVVASQAPGQSAGEVEACRQPSHGIGRRGLAEMFNRRF